MSLVAAFERLLTRTANASATMGRGEAGPKTTVSLEQWESKLAQVRLSRADMNRLVMNFLVTEGFVEAARSFEQEAGLAAGVELSSIDDRMHIRRAVQAGQVEQAIEQVNDMNPEILETHNTLLFHLHQQQLIEIIRSRDTQTALEFASEYLAPAGKEDPALLEELERTLALLAFNEPSESPLSDLLGLAQRHRTASELNAAILQAQSQDREARLPVMLKLLMWSQAQLAERANFPRITNLATGELDTRATS